MPNNVNRMAKNNNKTLISHLIDYVEFLFVSCKWHGNTKHERHLDTHTYTNRVGNETITIDE